MYFFQSIKMSSHHNLRFEGKQIYCFTCKKNITPVHQYGICGTDSPMSLCPSDPEVKADKKEKIRYRKSNYVFSD